MTEQSSNNNGRYLYAIMAGAEERNYGPCGIGDSIVYAICEGGAAAIVSDAPNKKIRPERRHLAAHQSVLKRLMEESTPLPMSFGIIADGPKAIQKILSHNRDAFREQFERVQSKAEMGLRVTWDVPNIFDYFVNKHRELRSVRDKYFGGQREPTHEDKIEVGRIFDRILEQDRENHTEDVENELSHHCFEIKRNPCRSEREVMNLACLVGREAEAQFEAGILKAANLFDNSFAFDYNGPWAPHNFVNLNLEF